MYYGNNQGYKELFPNSYSLRNITTYILGVTKPREVVEPRRNNHIVIRFGASPNIFFLLTWKAHLIKFYLRPRKTLPSPPHNIKGDILC